MNLDNRNQARRFILLIDTLYDHKTKLIISAASSPQHLFSPTGGDVDRTLMDDLKIEEKTVSTFYGLT